MSDPVASLKAELEDLPRVYTVEVTMTWEEPVVARSPSEAEGEIDYADLDEYDAATSCYVRPAREGEFDSNIVPWGGEEEVKFYFEERKRLEAEIEAAGPCKYTLPLFPEDEDDV